MGRHLQNKAPQLCVQPVRKSVTHQIQLSGSPGVLLVLGIQAAGGSKTSGGTLPKTNSITSDPHLSSFRFPVRHLVCRPCHQHLLSWSV